ncbi:deleted in malignant brain tumors 1 protein-like isoform X3 [Pomacea canaliculata]|uniref:deleted in malignant brain tumors 1 protein-like isoform X3 n=1 Tax=Pomacea canaliculata TaxID=400727 RepID=UPI000D735D69|nr:deleted in malignant brain tumors 1 protein-like isoform X3 [Pomacea canaliculata]
MERRRLCLIAWTIAAGALSGCDSQCVTNSRPAHLIANQNKTLSFSVQSVGSNASCEWLISSNTISTRLRLTATIFNLRSSNGTCVDNFTIYDGSSSFSPILLSTCSRPNFPIYSSGSDVLVSFTTGRDNFGTTSNFTVNYEVLKISNATIIDSVNVDIGALHIFKYPEGSSQYPNNANRGWVFDTNDSQYVVHVVVAYVDVETASAGCDFDYVEIFDSSVEANRRDRLCGTLTSREYYSTGQSLYITFHSNGSQTRSGFNLTYTAALRSAIYPAPVCSSSTPLAAVLHNKQFLRYPAVSTTYTTDRDCGWSIQSASLDYVVHVTFVYVSIPTSRDCYSDYVQVYDGSSTLSNRLASVCGNEPGQEFYSYGRSLFIQFHSSTNNIPGGFHLSYESVLRSEAPPHAGGTEIVNVDLANEHFLKYPEGSSAYPNNANRGWVFYSTDPKYVVHIQFTQLDVELSATGCDFDYIEVFDSSAEEKKLDRLCGFMTRPQYYSTGEFLYLTFHSNGVNVGTGFNITYRAALQATIYPEPVCSPSLPLAALLHDNKFLKYPALTSASSNNYGCGWSIQSGSVNYTVHVTFLFC